MARRRPTTDQTWGEYDYDAQGRRVYREADVDHNGSLEESVRYLYDGDQVVEECYGAAAEIVLRIYVYGNYIDEPLWMKEYSLVNAGEYVFCQDENFNVYELYQWFPGPSWTSPVHHYRYDAYGSFVCYEAIGPTSACGPRNSTLGSSLLYYFQGRRFDMESGLYEYRARYYNPDTGRFTSFDPLGYVDGMNLYEFTGSGPLDKLDPYGLLIDEIKYGSGVAVGFGEGLWDQIGDLASFVKDMITDPIGTLGGIMDGISGLIDQIKSGNAMDVLATLSPGLAEFIKTHFMDTDHCTGESKYSAYEKGKALGRMLSEILPMLAGAGVAAMSAKIAGKLSAASKLAQTAKRIDRITPDKPPLGDPARALSHDVLQEINGAGNISGGDIGRAGRQARLRELASDPKASSADRGWIRQEMNQVARGQRRNIRVPPGKVLAHRRGKEARKGFDYEHSDLQEVDLHKLQHKHGGYR